MRRLTPPAALFGVSLLAGCGQDYPNPFEDPSLITTVAPPEGTHLVFASDGWASAPGRGRELMAVALDGSLLTRLTFCDAEPRPCDVQEAALAPDNERATVRRVVSDTSGDGRLDDDDDASLVYVDLAAQVEAELLPASDRATGIDWSPAQDILVYSAQGVGGQDLFRSTPRRPTPDNQQETVNLSCTSFAGAAPTCNTQLSELRPRIDPGGTIATYSRFEPGGSAEVWIFQTTVNQARVTTGTTGGAVLPGSPYRVGSDADATFAPDGRTLVFRHLVAAANDGRGAWEIRTVQIDGSGLRTLAGGGAWRGAPAWGPDGIVFPEADAAGTRLVIQQADGSGRRDIVSFPAGFRLDNPRWLRR
jgi:hypothetical protein